MLLLIPFITACGTIKTMKIMRGGELKQKDFKVEVPFEYRLGLIILKVNIHGKDYDFVLDTGAPNVLSEELAAELKLVPSVSQKAEDSQGASSDLKFVKVDKISIGGLDFLNTGAAVADLQQSKEVGCLKIAGFVGANLMKQAIWQFDYDKQIITITDNRNKLNIPADAATIKFTPNMATGTPFTNLTLNGIKEEQIVIDLGSNGDFSCSKECFSKLKKANKLRNYSTGYGIQASGLYGKGEADTSYFGNIEELEVGDIKLQNKVVSFSSKKAKTVGTNFFRNYKIIIDWSTNEMKLIKVKEYSGDKSSLGFGFSPEYRDGKLFVGFIHEQSKAHNAGIKIGDRIMVMNGKNYDLVDGETWCEIINKGLFTGTEKLSLKVLRDNKEMNFELAK